MPKIKANFGHQAKKSASRRACKQAGPYDKYSEAHRHGWIFWNGSEKRGILCPGLFGQAADVAGFENGFGGAVAQGVQHGAADVFGVQRAARQAVQQRQHGCSEAYSGFK